MSLGTNLFGSEIELISERSGKCLVRSIAGIECDGQNIGGTLREPSRRLGQTPGAHVSHQRQPRGRSERSGEMES